MTFDAAAAVLAIGGGLGAAMLPKGRIKIVSFVILALAPFLMLISMGFGEHCIPSPSGERCAWIGEGIVLGVVTWPFWLAMIAIGVGLRRLWRFMLT